MPTLNSPKLNSAVIFVLIVMLTCLLSVDITIKTRTTRHCHYNVSILRGLLTHFLSAGIARYAKRRKASLHSTSAWTMILSKTKVVVGTKINGIYLFVGGSETMGRQLSEMVTQIQLVG